MGRLESAYRLPEGNVQVSFSGGRTSGYMLHEILAANGGMPDRAQVVFANTGREMPATLDFVQQCAERWSVPIVWVEDGDRASRSRGDPLFDVVSHNSASRNGEPFMRLIERKQKCPEGPKRFCTTELKVLPARRYLKSLGWRNWTNAVGIRADEAGRIRPAPDGSALRWFPLVDAGVTQATVMDWWSRQPFDLQVPKGLGNCDGCFLKSEAVLAALARDFPDRHAWWEAAEARAQSASRRPEARFNKSFTRTELRRFVEAQGDWVFDTEGALCQKNHGECT